MKTKAILTEIRMTEEELLDLARVADILKLLRLFRQSFVTKVRAAQKRMERRK